MATGFVDMVPFDNENNVKTKCNISTKTPEEVEKC